MIGPLAAEGITKVGGDLHSCARARAPLKVFEYPERLCRYAGMPRGLYCDVRLEGVVRVNLCRRNAFLEGRI